jgi:hypothetical protein
LNGQSPLVTHYFYKQNGLKINAPEVLIGHSHAFNPTLNQKHPTYNDVVRSSLKNINQLSKEINK